MASNLQYLAQKVFGQKYKAVLDTTLRNKGGCAIFQALEAYLIHEADTQELVDARFLSLQGDGGHDTSHKARDLLEVEFW